MITSDSTPTYTNLSIIARTSSPASVLKRIVRDAAFLVGSERVPVGEPLYRRAAVHSVSHIRKVVFVHFGNDGAPYYDYEKPDCIHMQYSLEPRKANAAQERCGLQLSLSKVYS